MKMAKIMILIISLFLGVAGMVSGIAGFWNVLVLNKEAWLIPAISFLLIGVFCFAIYLNELNHTSKG